MSNKDFVVKNGLVVGTTAIIGGIEIDPSGASSSQVLKFDGTKFIPSAGGSVTISSSAPASPSSSDLWFDSNTAHTFIYYDSHWIEIGGAGSGAKMFVSSTAPSDIPEGTLWFDSDTAQVFIKYDSHWIEVGGSGSSIDVANAEANDTLKFNGTKFVASPEGIFNDNILLINNASDSAPINNAGLEVERGSSDNVLIRWNESTDVWEFTNNGSTYQELGRSTATISTSAPASPNQGQIWFDSAEGGTYVYYASNWIEVGAAPVDTLLATINAKGDILVGTADNAVDRLGAGSNGSILMADSAQSTGLKWVASSDDQVILASQIFG